ncbi:hypothetical protein GCM10009736_76080 [Actinomadura bangladeshensis]
MPTRETSPHGRPPKLAVPERNWRQKPHHTVNFTKADKAIPPSPPASPYMSLGETTNRTELEPTPKPQDLLKEGGRDQGGAELSIAGPRQPVPFDVRGRGVQATPQQEARRVTPVLGRAARLGGVLVLDNDAINKAAADRDVLL